jgi:predicted DNA-binding antitoxin AbrB/MazE fold protein
MVKTKGILENGAIRLAEHVNLPDGIEVEITIKEFDRVTASRRRRALVDEILREPLARIAPLKVVDLVHEDRAGH